MKLQYVTIQMKAIEQYFHVVLFIMLYKVVLIFESVDKTLVCAIQMKATGTVLLLVTVSYPMHRGCCHFFLDETRVSLSKFGKRIYLLSSLGCRLLLLL